MRTWFEGSVKIRNINGLRCECGFYSRSLVDFGQHMNACEIAKAFHGE